MILKLYKTNLTFFLCIITVYTSIFLWCKQHCGVIQCVSLIECNVPLNLVLKIVLISCCGKKIKIPLWIFFLIDFQSVIQFTYKDVIAYVYWQNACALCQPNHWVVSCMWIAVVKMKAQRFAIMAIRNRCIAFRRELIKFPCSSWPTSVGATTSVKKLGAMLLALTI